MAFENDSDSDGYLNLDSDLGLLHLDCDLEVRL